MNEKSPKPKKASLSGALILFIVMIAASIAQDMGPRHRMNGELIFSLTATIAIVIFILIVVKVAAAKAKTRAAGTQPTQAYRRSSPTPRQTTQVYQGGGTRQPTRAYHANDPDAYCLVCDQTGVDHFERDRQRRLRQLDYFLSIGLIERKEYNLLRQKYSREVPHQKVV